MIVPDARGPGGGEGVSLDIWPQFAGIGVQHDRETLCARTGLLACCTCCWIIEMNVRRQWGAVPSSIDRPGLVAVTAR